MSHYHQAFEPLSPKKKTKNKTSGKETKEGVRVGKLTPPRGRLHCAVWWWLIVGRRVHKQTSARTVPARRQKRKNKGEPQQT